MGDESRLTTDRYYGDIDRRLENLEAALEHIVENAPSEDELIEWVLNTTNAENQAGVERRLGFLETIDLLERDNGDYFLTPRSEEFLRTDDTRVIFEGLRKNVIGFEPLLKALYEQPLSIEDFHDILAQNNDFTGGPGVAGRHREWLQVLNLITETQDGRYRLTAKGRKIAAEIEDHQPAPAVWIEKTQIEDREYKQEGKYRLGEAIMSPSRDQAGGRRYETMREAEVGDIVIHLLQDRLQFVGVSVIDSELHEDFEGPPDDRWTEDQQEQGGY